MPDLNIVVTYLCRSNIDWEREIRSRRDGSLYTVRFDRRPRSSDTQYDYTCTCKAFTFGHGKYCKHIMQANGYRCGWNDELEPTAKTALKNGEHVCPECAGPVEAMKVGV